MDIYFKSKANSEHKHFENVIRLYEEISDNLLLIPASCQIISNKQLERCYQEKVDDLLNEYSKKYMLRSSMAGVTLFRFLEDQIDTVINKLSCDGLSDNPVEYKRQYINLMNLFLKFFRNEYKINEMTDVEELENNIGFQVEKSKTENSAIPITLALIDSLDKQLYNFFLDIKTSFNSFSPVSKDERVTSAINVKLKTLILNFKSDNQRNLTADTQKLLAYIIQIGKNWVRKHSVQYVVNTHPVNLRFEKFQNFAEVSSPKVDATDVVLNKPLLAGSMMPNMSEQMAQFNALMKNFARMNSNENKN